MAGLKRGCREVRTTHGGRLESGRPAGRRTSEVDSEGNWARWDQAGLHWTPTSCWSYWAASVSSAFRGAWCFSFRSASMAPVLQR